MNKNNQGWKIRQNLIDGYLESCEKSVKNEEVFENFRSNEQYIKILEHSTEKMGQECLNEIKKNEEIYNFYKNYTKNDNIGNPVKYTYDDNSVSSPTTLKYVRVLKYLTDEFGSLNDLNIVEVGGGYGGQCKIIKKFRSIMTYTLIDLYWPL